MLDDECRACVAFQTSFHRDSEPLIQQMSFPSWIVFEVPRESHWEIAPADQAWFDSALSADKFTRGGTVVTAGSTDRAHGLRGKDPAVERITKNVLDRLGK